VGNKVKVILKDLEHDKEEQFMCNSLVMMAITDEETMRISTNGGFSLRDIFMYRHIGMNSIKEKLDDIEKSFAGIITESNKNGDQKVSEILNSAGLDEFLNAIKKATSIMEGEDEVDR
jgi:hypothetical protein